MCAVLRIEYILFSIYYQYTVPPAVSKLHGKPLILYMMHFFVCPRSLYIIKYYQVYRIYFFVLSQKKMLRMLYVENAKLYVMKRLPTNRSPFCRWFVRPTISTKEAFQKG